MKRQISIVLLLLIPAFAFKAIAGKSNFTDSVSFKGLIAEKYPFSMVFIVHKNKVSGWYAYDSKKQKINITGTLIKDQFEIAEYNGKDTTGYFNGYMKDQFHVSGNWSKKRDDFPTSKFFEMVEMAYNTTMYQAIAVIENNTSADKASIISFNKKGDMVLNEMYLKNCKEPVRAILAYYSTQSGSDCWWENDNPNDSYTNMSCKFTKALGLGWQCSDKQKKLIAKWFAADTTLMGEADNCYSAPYTATVQNSFTELSIAVAGDKVVVKYLLNGVNIREDYSWNYNGIGVYKINAAGITRLYYK
ncbi:hypothetical protein [Ferruginibacter sp. SUN106]|uniref:hypothetical protein n=1 Tax=Ferruginibacter sp. SUN106 TaxID=2978348 RepID=UPI003D35F732